jgi:hypothetical protein
VRDIYGSTHVMGPSSSTVYFVGINRVVLYNSRTKKERFSIYYTVINNKDDRIRRTIDYFI